MQRDDGFRHHQALFLLMRGKHYRTLITLVDLPPQRLHEHVQKGTKPADPCPYEAMMRL